MKRYKFFNMRLTTTLSVALVLLLVGMEAILLLSAQQVIRQIKENVEVSIVLKQEADSTEVERLGKLLSIAPFASEARYVSKEEALREHIEMLGEDPTEFLGFNPLSSSYEMHLNAEYAHADSISGIEERLASFECIDRMVYPREVVNSLDKNIERLSIIFGAIALILLFVAVALIVNTVRLQIYSKRFLINTMKLVGARPATIKAPIIWLNVRIGLIASVIAIVLLAGAIYYATYQLEIRLIEFSPMNICILCGIVIATGVMITSLSSAFATSRYIRMKTNDLYYI